MEQKYDAIIIGAGVAGLISGTYLAKSGLKALIVEKNGSVGGCYSSFRRNGFCFDAAGQVIGSCGEDGILGSILDDLGINVKFIRLRTTDTVHFPEETVKFDGDFNKFKNFLKSRFTDEKKHIENFFALLLGAKKKQKILFIMKKYASCTYQALLDSFFEDRILKNILSAQCGCMGLPPDKLSSVSAIFLLKTYLIDGAYYPKGGSQVLSSGIAEAFNKYGGRLLLNSEVNKIVVKNNHVKGVVADGREFLSDFVISAADETRTYKKLIGHKNLPRNREFNKKLARFRPGSSCYILYLGLKKWMDMTGKGGWYYPAHDINKAYDGLINVHIPTNYDSTLSASGDSILIATFPCDYSEDKKSGRKEFKDSLYRRLLARLEAYFPDIEKNIIVKEIATPLTIERYTFNSKGSLYGWEQSPFQTHKNCFPISSTIKGLFHAGHWTLPGGGVVAVAVSGLNAAKKVLEKIIKKE